MKIRKSLFWSMVFCCMATSVWAQADEEGFVSIFNGKDLTGWVGDSRIWSVEDGTIVGTTDQDAKKLEYNTSLAYEEEMGDFVARFDFKISKEGNSGLYYRGWYLDPEGHPYQMGGYQADFDGQATYTGIVYGEAMRGILAMTGTASRIGDDHQPQEVVRFETSENLRAKIRIEDWNSYELIVKGNVSVMKVNDQITSVLFDEDQEVRRDSGMLGFQAHVGPPMKVEIKNVRVKRF